MRTLKSNNPNIRFFLKMFVESRTEVTVVLHDGCYVQGTIIFAWCDASKIKVHDGTDEHCFEVCDVMLFVFEENNEMRVKEFEESVTALANELQEFEAEIDHESTRYIIQALAVDDRLMTEFTELIGRCKIITSRG